MDLIYLLLTFILSFNRINANIGSWMNLGMQGIGIMNNELDSLGSSSSVDQLFQTPNFNTLDQNNPLLLNNLHNNGQQINNLQQQQHKKHLLKQQMEKLSCNELDGLSKGQTLICELNKDHIYFISRAAANAINECQHQFEKSRWNCSTYEDSSVFGPILNTGSKEVAFTSAISSAAVVHSLARACRDGALSNCGCSRAKRPNSLKAQYRWAGCGDNIDYAYRFGKPFVDVREEEQNFNKLSKKQGRKLMNLHNNEAGRMTVLKKTRVTCKCHGVSGSCSIVTCWQQLSSFREIGDTLKDAYDRATEVRLNKRGKLQVVNKKSVRPTKLDLVYVEDSPDYCTSNNPTSQFVSTIIPEVEQLPNNPNRLIAKKPLIAKSSKQSLSKKSRKYRSNKTTRQINSNKLSRNMARASIRNAQRRTLDRIPKAQRLISEDNNKNDNKHDSNSKLDNPIEEDNQTFKDDDLNQSFQNGQSSLIPQLTDQQQQELTDEQKEQLNQLMEKQNQKEIPKLKQMGWLGTHGRECNRSSLATDNCSILCCGRGYYTARVLVKEKCNCRFRWCCEIECDTCQYYKTINYCK